MKPMHRVCTKLGAGQFVGFHSSVGRALHGHGRGHGLEPFGANRIFQVSIRDQYLNCPVNCEDHLSHAIDTVRDSWYGHARNL